MVFDMFIHVNNTLLLSPPSLFVLPSYLNPSSYGSIFKNSCVLGPSMFNQDHR